MSPDGNRLLVLTDDGPGNIESQVMCFNAASGTKEWVTDIPNYRNEAIFCSGEYVFTLDSEYITQSDCNLIIMGAKMTGAVIGGWKYILGFILIFFI